MLRKSRAAVNAFRCFFAEGKIGGTPCMRSHIFIQLATTISFAKPFIFKIENEKEGLPRGSPAGLGAGGPEFKSRRPDQNISRVLFRLMKDPFTQTHPWNSGRQEFSIGKSFSFREFTTRRICENTGRQECYSETIERTQVKRPRSGKYGENSEDPVHFSSHKSSETQNSKSRAGLSSLFAVPLNCFLIRWLKLRSERSWRRFAKN